MAIVKRESGAWKTVTNKLKQAGIRINTQGELLQLLDTEKIKYAESVGLLEQKKQEADQRCKDEIAQIFAEQENSLSLIRKEFSRNIRPVQDRIDALKKQQDEVNEKSFFYKMFHLLEMIKLSSEVKKMNLKLRKITSDKNDTLKEQSNFFDRKRLDANQDRDDVIYTIKNKIYATERRITVMKENLESKEYCGAVAELKMIDFLRKLPNNYQVINDVSIKLNKSIRLDKEWIQSVQIDHLVIGPSGVFIIEVKNWSKKFASTGDFHDPYNQIKRHNRACYILLKEQCETKLRNIIACANHLPSKTDEKYIKVMPIEQVIGYILWFKEEIHDNQEVAQIARFFEGKINDTVSW